MSLRNHKTQKHGCKCQWRKQTTHEHAKSNHYVDIFKYSCFHFILYV